ncbi:putative pentatricopeptide repeat-containing protein At5g08310, mitochondrial isoform X2 [Carya illinoinensis]|uniref:putative pentatricopeptide repeat-containing protein At5g08310, mitochondrial isoform X2 n=1 Tax=Carya illinoinensis TaxID=32201 RepID=UPI001C7281D2|nr:putative pentatricopeptide repeat-containing protein At5g08310, mitochondrial isoform X2 [Carya illinoinensis]
MAPVRIKLHPRNLWRSVKPIRPYYSLVSLFFTETLSHASHSQRPLCTKACNNASFPSDLTCITDCLISIFTKRPFSPDDPELENLAPRLTTQVVESVLTGLKSWKIAHVFFTWASNQSGYKHNCYTYNVMATILSRAKKIDSLRAMTVDIVNSRCSITPGALGYLIRCLGSVGLIEEADVLFDQVRMMGLCIPNNYSYNCLLEAICKSKSIDLIEMRLKEMQDYGWKFDKYTLTPVLQVYCSAGKFEKALSLFNDMIEQGWVDEHVFSILVLNFSKWGEVDKALELIERMERHNVRLNQKTFYVLIHGFVKESRVDKAIQLFDKMRQSGFNADLSLYDVLIGGLCENKEMEKALCLYSEMKKMGIHPDVRIITKLMTSSSEEREMIRFLSEGQEDKEEDMILLYNSFLNCLVNNSSLDKALLFLQVMMGDQSATEIEEYKCLRINKAIRPNTTSFIIVINGLLKTALDGLIKIHEVDQALELFRDICSRKYCPDVIAYNIVIGGLCKAKRVSEAEGILNDMVIKGLVPSVVTYNLLIDGWCKNDNVDQAMLCLSRMFTEDRAPNVITYTTLVDGLLNAGRPDDALVLWNEMGRRGCAPNRIAFMALIHGLCKCGRPDPALVYLREMEEKGMKPDTFVYVALMNSFVSNFHLPLAFEILKEMVGKGKFPEPLDKNYLVFRDAVLKLSEDATTSSDVKNLIAEGRIAGIFCSDVENEG